jgi:hypothetical protein
VPLGDRTGHRRSSVREALAARVAPALVRVGHRRTVLLIAVAFVYAAVATASGPWTVWAYISTAIPGLVAIWYAVRRGWHRRDADVPEIRVDRVALAGLVVWGVLFALLATWVLSVFFSHPRVVYPTPSYMMDIAFHNYPLRVAAFAAWLGAGWYVLRR